MSEQKRFDSINISEDFGITDLQNLDEDKLQEYLINDPIPEGVEPVKEVEKDPVPATGAEVEKDKNKNQPLPNGEEALKKFLTEAEPNTTVPSLAETKPGKILDTGNAEPELPGEDDNVYATLNEDLQAAGIFSNDEDQPAVTDAKSFKDKFLQEMNKGANSIVEQFLSQHGPEYRDAFDAIFIKGVNPSSYYSLREQIDDFESLDMSKEENQEKILRSFYQNKGFSADKITSKIQKIKDYGDLEEDAQQVHEIMLKEHKQRLDDEKEEAEQEAIRREQNKVNYRTAIQSILQEKLKQKEFEGIPITGELAQKIYYNLTQEAFRLPNSKTITTFEKDIMELSMPENFEKKIKLALLLANNFDFSSIKKAAIKEETNNLFEGLERKKKKKQLPSVPDTPKYF